MPRTVKHLIARRILAYESLALAFIVVVIWLNEVLDIPHRLLGAGATAVNWREAVLESVIIIIVGVTICRLTAAVLARMRYLEGILPICAACKRIRDEQGAWHPVESYVHDRSEAEFSHGICPECAHRFYPDYTDDKP